MRLASILTLVPALASPLHAQLAPPALWSKSARILAIADLDGDGSAELIEQDTGLSTAGIYSWDGEGALVLRRRLGTADSFGSPLEVVDADGDGDLDALQVDPFSGTIRLYENRFGFQLDDPMDVGPSSPVADTLAVADVDGDGVLDVLSTRRRSSAGFPSPLLWYRGLGAGAYASPTTLLADSRSPRGVVPVDINGDGNIDFVTVVDTDQRVVILLGDGAGSYLELPTDLTDAAPASLSIEDLSGDGELDICIHQSGPARVSFAEGLGDGTFQPPIGVADGYGADDLLLASDLDGDGDRDLIGIDVDRDSGAVNGPSVVVPNLGGGAFGAPTSIQVPNRQSGTGSVFAGDLDGNGRVDLLITGRLVQPIRDVAFLVSPEGAPGALTARSQGNLNRLVARPSGFSPFDHDGDGVPELLATSVQGPSPTSFDPGDLDTFRPTNPLTLPAGPALLLVHTDIDADGQPETLHIDQAASRLTLIEGPVDGAATLIAPCSTDTPRLIPADFDGDGDLDIVGSLAPGSIAWIPQQADGHWGAPIELDNSPQKVLEIEVADVNSDGIQDIVFTRGLGGLASGPGVGQPVLLLGLGGGTVSAPVTYDNTWSTGRSGGLALLDLDGDTDLDIAVPTPGGLGWFANDGLGQFGPVALLSPTPSQVTGVHAIELDGDRSPEIVLQFASEDGSFSRSDQIGAVDRGASGLWTTTQVTGPSSMELVDVLDVDADGDLDVVVWNRDVLVFENRLISKVGAPYCSAGAINSTGQRGELELLGRRQVSANQLTARVSGLPIGAFGYVLVSRQSGSSLPAGAIGELCLGGAVGRYVAPGQIQQANSSGRFELPLDLTSIPGPLGPVVAQPNDLWRFQAWYRDGTASAFTGAAWIRLE